MPLARNKVPKIPRVKYVLVLQDHAGTLFGPSGQVQHVTPETLSTLTGKGSVEIIDLSGLARLTYTSLPDFTLAEIPGVIALDPAAYLPGHPEAADLYLSTFATTDDQQHPAALTAYVERAALADLTQALAKVGLHCERLSPGLTTAAQPHLHDPAGTLVVQIGQTEYLGLMLEDGQIRGLVRELPRGGAAAQEIMLMLTSMSNVLRDARRVVLVGPDEVMQDVTDLLRASAGDIEVVALTPTDLAQVAAQTPSRLHLRPVAPARSRPAWLPLVAGIAIGTLPALVVSLLNAGTQRQITTVREQITAMQPQIDEVRVLETEIARIHAVQTKADAITRGRIDWNTALARLISQLPENRGELSVRLTRLQADLPTAPPPAPPTQDASTSTGASAALPDLQREPTYRLELLAASRYAAAQAITNFEQTYAFDMQNLSRETTGQWAIRAAASPHPNEESGMRGASTAVSPEQP